ncbi:hypothetical protein NA78x_003790 [Anatilimnocola sp. NA78]|uniref:hypothetical protein n=1 Tax=Anatilimnocola sp. NA78 TaxID=3415683 RepID=UPI003CE4F1FA
MVAGFFFCYGCLIGSVIDSTRAFGINLRSALRLSEQSVWQLLLAVHVGLLTLISCEQHLFRGLDSLVELDYESLRTLALIASSVFIAQVALIAIGAVFGHCSLGLRLSALLLLFPLLAVTASNLAGNSFFFLYGWLRNGDMWTVDRHMSWLIRLSAFAAVVCLTGGLVRLLGFDIRSEEGTNAGARCSVSLRDLLSVFLVICVTLAIFRWLQSDRGWTWRRWSVVLNWHWPFDTAPIRFALFTHVVLFATLSRLSLWRTLPCLIGVTLLFSLADATFFRPWITDSLGHQLSGLFYLWSYSSYAVVLGGSLLVVRDLGYRLCRQPQSKSLTNELSG